MEYQFFNETFEFKSEMGFNIAAMFTAYDDNPEPVLDPTYGELIFRYEKWGSYPNDTSYYEEEYLDTHYCTDEELGYIKGDSKQRFLPMISSLQP